jgi:hypothetical protein
MTATVALGIYEQKTLSAHQRNQLLQHNQNGLREDRPYRSYPVRREAVRCIEGRYPSGRITTDDRHPRLPRRQHYRETYGGDELHTQRDIVGVIHYHLRPLLIDQDVRDFQRLWEAMFHIDLDLGNRGFATSRCIRGSIEAFGPVLDPASERDRKQKPELRANNQHLRD